MRRLFRLGDRARAHAELDEEIRLHLQARAEQLMAHGTDPTEAWREAVHRFSSAHESFDEARRHLHHSADRRERRMTRHDRLHATLRELAQSMRTLRRSPGFTVAAVLTLALGLGASSAVFGLMSAVLLRTPAYANPARLVMVWQHLPEIGEERLGASAAEYLDYRDRNRVFSSIAGYSDMDVDLTGNGEPERLTAARVTSSLFPTLGVTAALGRTFTQTEDRFGAPKVAVLSYALWQGRFGGDPHVLGRTLRLDEQSYTVIGVMPRGFEFPWTGTPLSEPAQLWVPMAYTPHEIQARAESYDTRMIARLAPGVSAAQAARDVQRIAGMFRAEYPQVYTGNMYTKATAEPLEAAASERTRPLLLMLLGAVAFVLLIACANVANLLLARAIARQREVAVRRALGASGARIAAQALAEALVIAAAGAAAGLAVAAGLVRIVQALGSDQIPGLAQARIDGRVLAFTAILTLITALACALAPAWRSIGQDPQQALRQGGARQAGGGRRHERVRAGLAVLEAVSAMVLLVGAGLLVRSFVHVLLVPPGFDPDGVVVARTAFDPHRYGDADRRHVAEHAIEERLAALPGVTAVGLTTHIPIADERSIGFVVEGRDPNDYHFAANALVDANYFRAMHIPLRRGRTFGAGDTPDAPLVAVINETMAREYWPNADPIGHAVLWGGRRLTIIGIAGDVRVTALDAPVGPMIYNSVYQVESGASQFAVFTVRTTAHDPAALLPAVRRAVWSVDPGLPVFGGTTLDEIVQRSLAARRLAVWLVAGFGVAALALALVGLYGVLSYSVAQRTPEIGVRMAIGARPADVSHLVVWSGLRLTALGVALGAVAGFAAAKEISSLLFGVQPGDPLTYGAAAALLLAAAALASYLPARRAARLDPVLALRAE